MGAPAGTSAGSLYSRGWKTGEKRNLVQHIRACSTLFGGLVQKGKRRPRRDSERNTRQHHGENPCSSGACVPKRWR